MTLFLLLSACGPQVTITPGQGGCTDFNYSNPEPTSLDWEITDDGAVRVWRAAALLDQTGLVFDPEILSEGKILHVHEEWQGGETDESFCYEPSIVLSGLAGKLQVRWYLEGEDAVFATADVEPS